MREIDSRELVHDMRKIIEEAEKLLQATAGDASEKIVQARSKAEKAMQDARRRLGNAEELALFRARQAVRAADRTIRSNPWESLGIAAAVGLVAGIILARR